MKNVSKMYQGSWIMDGVRFISQLINDERKEVPVKIKKKEPPKKPERIDIDKPLWNQDHYLGRWKHFAFVTDFRTVFVPEQKLRDAKKLCEDYKVQKEPKNTTMQDVIYAKKLRDSAFHPDNGELMNIIGRMSFQLPGCLVLTAGMLVFYKTTRAVVGWQITNQAFNAVVNYTNRNAKSDSTNDSALIKQAFHGATLAGCGAALGFRKLLSKRGPLYARWAPFAAVAMANMVNLPIMRQREIARGIVVSPKDVELQPIMKSKIAAVKGITECVISRIAMAAPGMIFIPVIINGISPCCFYQKRPWISSPLQTALCGLFLLLMIPTALAIYPQRNSMKVDWMKWCGDEYEEFRMKMKGKPEIERVYYNKGL